VKRYSMRNPQLTTWLGGIAIGAMAMYLSDPAQGRRRRWQVQEKMRTATEKTGNILDQAMHATSNRLSEARRRTKSMLRHYDLDDESLQHRLRNAIALLVSAPEAINIKAEQGKVTLSGMIDAKEKNRLLRKLRRVPGVRELRDQLALDSTDRRQWFRKEKIRHVGHEPGAAGHQGMESADKAIKRAVRSLPVGPVLAVLGLGYTIQRLGKSMRKRPRARSTAFSRDSVVADETINLQKSIEIQASPETVFNIWSKYDNFPQFMSHLVDVQSLEMQRSHWKMQGPAGVPLEWDAVLTEYREPTMLAWRTEPSAPVEHNGSVRFESSNGGTRATVRMYYRPVAGRSNNIVALLGNNPEQDLEDDLLRMKNFIEGSSFPRENVQNSSSSGQVLH
jgi:uncharacterized membrane protein